MLKTVEVVKVEKVKAGKTDRAVVHYKGDDGTDWKIGALVVKLDEDSRKFLGTIKKASNDNTFKADLEMKKEGDYWNLTKVAEAGTLKAQIPSNSTTQYTRKSYKPKEGELTDVERGEGQRRGNVLSNATSIAVAYGKTPEEALKILKNVVNEVNKISKTLEEDNKNTVKNEVAEQQNQEAQHSAEQDFLPDEVSDELGF